MIGSDRAGIESAISDTKKADGVMSVPVTMTLTGKQINVSVAASAQRPRGDARRNLDRLGLESGADFDRARRKSRPRTHLLQRGAQPLKVGDWNGSSGSWTVPLENISREGVDAAVVYVQDGNRERPGPMLGAAYTSLH